MPETQRGLVISEIAQFRERAAKREREKMRDVRESIPLLAPSGPKREWGKSQSQQAAPSSKTQASGKGSQGYNKSAGFVKAESDGTGKPSEFMKTDEELEAERKEARRRDEENSFRDVSIDSHDYYL